MDAESEGIFYRKLEEKEKEWRTNKQHNPGCVTGFYEWFCEHKVD